MTGIVLYSSPFTPLSKLSTSRSQIFASDEEESDEEEGDEEAEAMRKVTERWWGRAEEGGGRAKVTGE